MELDLVEIQFDGRHPWRTLFHLFWPERRAALLAMLAYLFKASTLWILPVVTANIIDVILRRANRILHSTRAHSSRTQLSWRQFNQIYE